MGSEWPNPCPCPQGSMYDGLADNYNSCGTTGRSGYYSKFQAGNGAWGYPVRSGFPQGVGSGFVEEKACPGRRDSGAGWEGSPRGGPPALTGSARLAIISHAALTAASCLTGYF